MKLIDVCKSGLAPAALLLLSLPSCDSESSPYDALRQELRAYQQAATKTVDSMVAVQAGLTSLATSAQLSDEELTAAVRSFDEAVLDFGHAAEQIVAAETNIQNAIRDLSTGQGGIGVVQQALGARDVANVLTGGVVGLADKMDANRQAINAAYDELYKAYDDADMDGIEAAKAKINSLGQDTLFSWLKKTTTTLIAAPVGAVVEGVKKGAVALKVGVKTAVSAVWSKGCDIIAGPSECSGGIEAEGCAVSFNRTDEAGRAEVPAGNVTLLVSGDDLARVRLDDVPIAQNEEKEIVLPETPINEVDEDNLANGEIPEPVDTATIDTNEDKDSGEDDDAYILCVGTNFDDLTMYGVCVAFNGSLEELNQLSVDERNGLCLDAYYDYAWETYPDGASCAQAAIEFNG